MIKIEISSNSADCLNPSNQLFLPFASDAGAEAAFRRVFRRMSLRRSLPEFRVEFRSYAGLRSSVQMRDGLARVRISDLLAEAPPLVLEALAEILLAQLYRRRPSREARECYMAYIFRPEVRGKIDETRRNRGSKRLLAPRGRCFDVERIFRDLNRRFFRGELRLPRLGWSPTRSRTILGHYDSAHDTIIISRLLDSPRTPRFLIEYLVYHEMLHMRFPVERRGHRRVVHSPEFRQAERNFPKYEQARKRLKPSCP